MAGLGGNTTLGIGLSITLVDRFSRRARAITDQMQAMGMSANQVRRNMSTSLQGMQTASLGMIGVGYGAVKMIQKTTAAYAQFEYIMKSVQAVAGDTKLPMNRLDMLSAKAKELGMEFGQLPTEVAKGMFTLAKAGVDTEAQLLKITKSVLSLSAAADEPADKMAHDLVSVLNMFGLEGKHAAVVADMLAEAANAVQLDVKDIFESIKYSGNTARSLGIPLEKALANITMMGAGGMAGSMSGVAIQNAMLELTNAMTTPKNRQLSALASLGLSPADIKAASRDLTDMVGLGELLYERVKGMDKLRATDILEDLTNRRGNRFLTALVYNYEKLRNFQRDIINSGGSANTIAQKRLDSAAGARKRFDAAKEAFNISAGEAFRSVLLVVLPLATKFLKVLTKIVQHPVGKFFLLGATAVMLLVGALGLVLLPLATLGLLLINGRIGFQQMRIAGVWAFNAIANAARRAAVQMRLATGMGTPGRARYPAGTYINGVAVGGRYYNPAYTAAGMTTAAASGGAGAVAAGRRAAFASNALMRLAGAAFLVFSAFEVFNNFMTGRMMPALSGLVGGIAGWFLGGPIGAAIGLGLGSLVGDLMDSGEDTSDKRKKMIAYRFGNNAEIGPSMKSHSVDDYMGQYGNTPANRYFMENAGKKPTQVNINIDGKKAMERYLEDRDEDITVSDDLY